MTTVRAALAILRKDLRVELRAREVLYPTVFFAALVVLVGSFSFLGDGRPAPEVAGGVLWVALALAGTLGIGRVFEREREGDTFRALLLAPVPRAAVFLGKLAAVVLFMLAAEAVAAPLVGLLFSQPLARHPARLAALLLLGTAGFACVGAVLGATLLRTRGRDLLLHLFLYPLVMPVLLAGASGTAALLQDPPAPEAADRWIRLLVAYDAVVLVVGLWTFEPLAAE